MNTLLSRISAIASQLQQEGKSPSLALVRARLGGGINPTELFSAYQSWRAQGSPMQQQQEAPAAPAAQAAVVTPPNWQADIARLEHKLDLILQLLQSKS
ncbi:MAG: hypothetical protein E6Q75_08255 [Rheinheimera sp.]|nr:MAG: hypothetical protein E6Q75_08255 [Rheinheimera sp.]